VPVTFEWRLHGFVRPRNIAYTAFRSVSALSEPRLTADSPEHVLHPETASFRRSRRRLWKVSQRPPIPTALLLITTESVPAGTARSVTEEADSRPALLAVVRTGRRVSVDCP
jgi:hypothetical protein